MAINEVGQNAGQLANVDVDTTAPTDGQVLEYNNTTGKWVASAKGSAFTTIAVAGQTSVAADSAADTLTLAAGANVTLTTNAGTDTVTIAAASGAAALAGIEDLTSSNDDQLTIADSVITVNIDGDDLDFRVEGDTNPNLLFCDGGTDRVGVGTGTPTEFFEIEGSTANLSIRNTAETEAGIIFSDTGAPLTQFAKILFDAGYTDSGLANGLSFMTTGGLGSPYTLTGSIDPTASTSVVGVGTAFTTELIVGDRITVSGETRVVATITNNTNLTVTAAFTNVANDTAVEMERRAMQVQSNGNIGMGVKPSTAGEKLALNGAMAFKSQTTAPAVTHDYAKLYAFDTTGPKFGTASLKLDGTNDYFHIAYDAGNTDFNFGTGQFTVEGWFRFGAASATSMELISIGVFNNDGLELAWLNNNSFKLYIDNASPVIDTGAGSFDPTLNQWYHIAATRDGDSDCRIFVDGTQVGSTANSTGTISGANGGVTGVKIGAESSLGAMWNGWIDEVRLSDNARYTSNFTPSTAAFGSDANTMGLYHFDGSDAATSGAGFEDSSSKEQDGSAVNGAALEVGVSELYAKDSDGNETKLSPHNDEGDWEYFSKNSKTGKTVRINMEEVVRDLGQLTGKDYIKNE